jgi:hypothetical protein
VKKSGSFVSGFLASLPAFLTGFVCCVPTVILALGSLAVAFTVAAVAIAPYLCRLQRLPLSGTSYGACASIVRATPNWIESGRETKQK